jgi:hypothetical protein
MKVLFICLFFFSAKQQDADYVKHYKNGFTFFQNHNYEKAIIEYKKSYQLKQYFKTAYQIGLCYNYLNNCDSSTKYLRIVLLEKDKNAAKYQPESLKMFNSCGEVGAGIRKKVDTKHVDAGDRNLAHKLKLKDN